MSLLVILARDKSPVFWPLHRQFIGDRIDVIVDRRYHERRREARPSSVDRRYGDRRGLSLDEQLREQGWAVVGDDVTRRPRVEWIVGRAVMSRRAQ